MSSLSSFVLTGFGALSPWSFAYESSNSVCTAQPASVISLLMRAMDENTNLMKEVIDAIKRDFSYKAPVDGIITTKGGRELGQKIAHLG